MNNRRKILSLILTVVLIMSFTAFVFAEGESEGTGSAVKNKVTASFDNSVIDGTNNTCLWAGTVALTNTSGRTLVSEGETLAYHVVDSIGFTLYLQRKPTSNGVVSTIATYKYSVPNSRIAYNAYSKTVTQSGYYRISAMFKTVHGSHGTEGESTTTSWMWID